MELSDREYRVVGMALMLYATSPATDRTEPHAGTTRWGDGSPARERELADRAIANELYYKFLSASAGVPTSTPRVVPLGTASG